MREILIFLLIAILSPISAFALFNEIPRPEFFGIYLVSENELITLKEYEISLNSRYGAGLKIPPEIEVRDQALYFILFDDKISHRDLELSKFYYNSKVWTVDENIKLKVAPVKNEKFMYRLVPSKPLDDGVYAIHYGNLSAQVKFNLPKKLAYPFIFGESDSVLKKYNEIQKEYRNLIRIGINAPLTGDIPKVGEGTKKAAQMWLEDINAAGGLKVGGEIYPVNLVVEDNESNARAAAMANKKMITTDGVLAIVGPQSSKQAVPAGEVANNYQTPMISPWSTNPATTENRHYVFRASFLDPYQGPVVASFVKEEFGFTKAAVLYDVDSNYPKALAEFFKKAWEDLNGSGSVVAYETFSTQDYDFISQLTEIIHSEAEFLFLPQYYNEVALIVQQARMLGWNKLIVGSDSWGSAETIELCGSECYGLFFSTHYAAAGATGATKEFIDRYEREYSYIPDDVGALTWDAMGLVQQAITDCGIITGDIKKDRQCVRDALAKITDFNGITGTMTFDESGNPVKCAVMVRISEEGKYELYKWVCP